MVFHPEEYQAALAYWKGKDFPHLAPEQRALISAQGKKLIQFHLAHPHVHHLINIGVFVCLFGSDWWVLMRAGALIHSPVLGGLAVGMLHAAIMYSLAVFSLHEGAAHKLIILRQGRMSRFFSWLANNVNRISLAESDYYAKNHLSHHAHFTTEKDDEFLNFVSAKRFYGALTPFASVFNFSDFKAHTGMRYTPSRLLSLFLTALYHGFYAWAMLAHYSWVMVAVAFLAVFPNLAFWLDRMRQYMEHNLMPLNTVDGARDLGLGAWGILIGGGPWGQPCHWSHHLYPGIPWYQQLRLHRYLATILTAEQKKRFFLDPLTGYPRALFAVLRST